MAGQRQSRQKQSRRHFTVEFKRQAVERMQVADNIVGLAQELGVARPLLYQSGRLQPKDVAGRQRASDGRARNLRWAKERQRNATRLSWLREVLAKRSRKQIFSRVPCKKGRGATAEQRKLWRNGIYDQIQEMMQLQGSLSIDNMCRLAMVSRAGFYRNLASGTG